MIKGLNIFSIKNIVKKAMIFICLSFWFFPKSSIKKRYLAIEKPLIWTAFLSCISLFSLQSSAVNSLINDLVINNQYTVIADIYYSVFPYLQDENLIRSQNYVANDISTKWASFAEIYDEALLAFIIFPAAFFAFQYLFQVMQGTTEANTSSRFYAMALVLFLASPMSTVEVETATGKIHKANTLRYVKQAVLGRVISDIEKVIQINNDQEVSISSIQIAEARALKNDFKTIANAFMKNIDTSNSTNLKYKLNIGFSEGKYIARFEMGGEKITITFLSNESLNHKASRFSIDLLAQEKEMIKDYFKALFEHATKLNKNISNIKLSVNEGKSVNFTDFDNLYFKESIFEKDYKEYCENIYSYDLSGADLGVVNTYIDIASQCASHKFLAKHYENPNFDADKILSGKGDLKHRNAMLFGLNEVSMTFDKLQSEAIKLCSTSYFVCAEAVQLLSRENLDNGHSLGLLSTPVHIINKLLSSYTDEAGEIMVNRVISQESIQSFSYVDNILDNKAEFNIEFDRGHYNNGFEVLNIIDLVDVSKMGEPSISAILDTVSGSSFSAIFQRAGTCFNRQNEIINGFKCNSATKELTDLGTGFVQWAINLKSGAMLIGFNHSKNKGIALKMAEKGLSKYSSKVGSAIGSVSAIFAPVAFDNYFKSSPYFSAQGAQGMITTALILEYFGVQVVDYLHSFAWVLICTALLIYYIVFGTAFRLFLAFLMKIYGTMINTLIFFNRAYINSYSRGLSGIEELYDEFVIDLSQILLIGIMTLLIMSQMEMALIVIFDFIGDYLEALGTSITSQIMNIPALVSILISLFIVMKNLPNVILDKVEAQYHYLLEEINK